ncbi:tetratricopeptide repeat protein [Salibacterium halotolerans]|uniref:TPR repeat-containing protein n=1 Tax=Salibacterium halotolerans TaxID=1884432 RepID=A0A1I5WVX1_9BACI|nr:tetratricopeptide repeat protein [Salibacterium halotolerans]SFQ23935.1 TPR repeat-containing protein [Salibacterium halotolerans]
MKKSIIVLFGTLLVLSGCSTYGMNQHLEEEQRINTEKYAYDDENFVYDRETLQTLAERFRLDKLSESNINSIMEEEIENGNFNEIIIYLRELQAEEEEQAAAYSQRYTEALQAHIEQNDDPATALVEDAASLLQQQYQLNPENEENLINYANVLIESGYNVDKGTQLLFDLEQQLQENNEQPGRDLLLALAKAYRADGQYEESLQRYERLTALDSENPTHYYRMSQVYAEMGNEQGEQEAVTRAFEPTSEFLNNYGDDSYQIYKNYLDSSIEGET